MASDVQQDIAQTSDIDLMETAIAQAEHARLLAPPNPWVGASLVTQNGSVFVGYTQRPGNDHAERVALRRAGDAARGATLYVTLEPCSHHGRTPPCVDAIIDSSVSRVVVAVVDPDQRVSGAGIEHLRQAGIDVEVGVCAQRVEQQLAPYLHHRRTGLPYVVLKSAATLDGQTAAPDQTSQWITGPEARKDAHRLRAESDAIIVGAGTVRADNPRLTVRDVFAVDGKAPRQPVRVVLGAAPPNAAVRPCVERGGPIDEVLEQLGKDGVVSVLVEGGAHVASQFHHAGVVNRYVVYVAPVFMGGNDGKTIFSGSGAGTISDVFRGTLDGVQQLGNDVRIDIVPTSS